MQRLWKGSASVRSTCSAEQNKSFNSVSLVVFRATLSFLLRPFRDSVAHPYRIFRPWNIQNSRLLIYLHHGPLTPLPPPPVTSPLDLSFSRNSQNSEGTRWESTLRRREKKIWLTAKEESDWRLCHFLKPVRWLNWWNFQTRLIRILGIVTSFTLHFPRTMRPADKTTTKKKSILGASSWLCIPKERTRHYLFDIIEKHRPLWPFSCSLCARW